MIATRAVIVEDAGAVAVRDVPPPAGDGRALVEVERAGLCGTDLRIVAGSVPVGYPRVLGHEIVGTVRRGGPRGLVPPGTRVVVDPGVWCGHCEVCRRDLTYLCPSGGLIGRDFDGGFADLVAVDETRLHPIPDAVGADAAALLQVLATCVHAQSRVPVFPGQVAVVVGLGVCGLLHLQLLLARGVRTVLGVTRSAWKRRLATELGAAAVAGPAHAGGMVAQASPGGADIVVECAGTSASLAQAMDLAGPGATVLVFGTPPVRAEALPTYQWYFKELTIVGSRAARPLDYTRAVRLAADGTLRLDALVTARYPLGRAAEALAACADPRQLKVVLETA